MFQRQNETLIIKESFRLHLSLPLLLPRKTQNKVEINRYEILLNTKGRYSDQSEKFYPERFLDRSGDDKGFEFIPFGLEKRMCPGMLYAPAVVKVTLANLLFHFHWKLDGGHD
ncbi:Cytochrome P450 71D445 [Linum grandiflorum]